MGVVTAVCQEDFAKAEKAEKAEGQKGRKAERQKGRKAEKAEKAEGQKRLNGKYIIAPGFSQYLNRKSPLFLNCETRVSSVQLRVVSLEFRD